MISRLSLQKKSLLLVASILFIIITLNTAVLTINSYKKYKNAILSKTIAIGDGMLRDIRKIVNLGVPLESLDGLSEKLVELISRDEAIGFSLVMDSSGKILFNSDTESIGLILTDKPTDNALTSDAILVQDTALYYDIAFPIYDVEEELAGVLRVGVKKTSVKSQLYQLLFWALGFSVLSFALALILVYYGISRFITKPILAMEVAADRISLGNLTEKIPVKGHDEVSRLGDAINRMAFNLKDMIAKVSEITQSVSTVTEHIALASRDIVHTSDLQEKAIEDTSLSIQEMGITISQVASSTKNLSEVTEETSSSIMETKTSIEEIAENTNMFSESAHETASFIEELLTNVKQVAESVENLSASSGEIATSIEEVSATTRDIQERAKESVMLAEAVTKNASDRGMNASSAAIRGMEDIKNTVVSLSDVINLLGKKSVDIGKILKVINDVSEQTNLLGLNAAILAAQSGEYGKGFSVVADEIKALADRTSSSTKEIVKLIKSVQDETKSSIKMVSESIHTVESGMSLVQEVNATLKNIIESSQSSTAMARAIHLATEEEALSIKQITSSVENMTGQTERISFAIQEQSKGSNFIIQETEKVKNLASQVQRAINEQKNVSSQMAKAVDSIADQSAQIASATSRHEEKSVQIVKSMDNVRTSSQKMITSSIAMSEIISSLHEEASHLVEAIRKFKV